MGKSTRWNPGLKVKAWAAILIVGLAAISCHRDFESPYLPGSKDYAGDDWTRDSDGNGIADSVELYAPTCVLPPQQCIDRAKIISKLLTGANSLAAMDMILWLGDKASQPRLIWSPLADSIMEYVLVSSDSSKVKPKDGGLVAMAVGSAQITVKVPGNAKVGASFIAKVIANGKKVESVSAKSLSVYVGRDTSPDVAWTPSDAAVREYSLRSDNVDVAKIVGQKIRGVSPGKATITLESLDGGSTATFTVTVTTSPTVVLTDSILVEEMYMVAGDSSEAPIIHWYPDKAGDKRYNLLSLDSSVVTLNDRKDRVVPKATGLAHVIAYALDGSAKTASFIVNVSLEAVPVKGINAENLNLVLGADAQPPRLTWMPAGATNRKYSLSSSQPDVALMQGGLIVPVGMGTAELTATTQDGGYQASFLVTVGRPDTAIHVDSVRVQDLSISIGTDRRPVVAWYPDITGNRGYTLTSGDSSIAVPVGDAVHPIKAGAAEFTLTSQDGNHSSKFMVTVYLPEVPVTFIQADSMYMVLGGKDQSPSLAWSPSNATNLNYTLESKDSSIVTIVGGIKVHAKAVGAARVAVQSADGPTTSFNVVVNAMAVPVISLSLPNFTMVLGDPPMDPPNIAWNPANATNKDYTLKAAVGATVVVTVSNNKIVAANPGKTTVTVTSKDAGSPAAVCTVTVVSLVRSISAKDDTIRLGAADQDPSSLFTWDPPDASNKTYLIKGLDSNIVISPDGLKLRAVAGGKGRVRVKALDGSGKADTFNVLVKVPIRGMTAKDVTLKVSDSLINPWALFTWTPAEATDKNWYLTYPAGTSPTSIVKIVNGWELQAVGPGTANVTVVSLDSQAVRATFTVTVVVPAGGLSAAAMTVKTGEDAAPNLTWTPANTSDKGYTLSSSNSAVATAASGKVHGVGPGVATFTVTSTADPSKSATFQVTVVVPVISVSAADMDMKYGGADALPTLTWNPANATNKGYTLSFSNASVLSFVNDRIHALGPGNSYVYLTTLDGGKLDTFVVTVTMPVASITTADISMKKGDPDRDPVLTWNPSNATNKNYALTTSNASVVSIVGNKLHAAGGGSANITVTTADGGKTATFAVAVTVPVTGINSNDVTMSQNDPDTDPNLIWAPTDATNKGYTLSVVNGGAFPAVSIVGNKIQANYRGSETVQVTTADGGFTDTFKVTVTR